jgi:hypothetical protein
VTWNAGKWQVEAFANNFADDTYIASQIRTPPAQLVASSTSAAAVGVKFTFGDWGIDWTPAFIESGLFPFATLAYLASGAVPDRWWGLGRSVARNRLRPTPARAGTAGRGPMDTWGHPFFEPWQQWPRLHQLPPACRRTSLAARRQRWEATKGQDPRCRLDGPHLPQKDRLLAAAAD